MAKTKQPAKTPPVEGGTVVPEDELSADAAQVSQAGEVEVLFVTLRHKTPNQVYRRAGVVLTKVAKQYQVTLEQYDVLLGDAWVEVVPDEGQEGAEK